MSAFERPPPQRPQRPPQRPQRPQQRPQRAAGDGPAPLAEASLQLARSLEGLHEALEPHPYEPRGLPRYRPLPAPQRVQEGLAGLLADADGAFQALRIARGDIHAANNARLHALKRVRFARSRLQRLREAAGILTTSALAEVDDALAELDAAEIDLGVPPTPPHRSRQGAES